MHRFGISPSPQPGATRLPGVQDCPDPADGMSDRSAGYAGTTRVGHIIPEASAFRHLFTAVRLPIMIRSMQFGCDARFSAVIGIPAAARVAALSDKP